MRHWIVVLMVLPILAVLAPELPARTNTDWDNVRRLKQGSEIEVLLHDGTYLHATFYSATDSGLEISVADRRDPQFSFTHEVERSSVRRIVQVRVRQLPEAKRWMTTGALAGGGVGLVGGAIVDGTHGTNYHWLAGGFGGAIAGFFVSCVALAAVAGVESAKGRRRTKIVYDSAESYIADVNALY
jgi:outer membrane lipoprotein SlyB